MSLTHMTVAVSDSFFTAYARLPKNQQAKVMNFVNKFRLDPTSGGIHYETLKNVKDRRLRSVRIDDDYRGILCKPNKENVYLLLWVDKHDAAYQWARNRVCEINPLLGTVQVFCVDETVDLRNADSAEDNKPTTQGLFDDIRDRELLAMGVPEIQLEMIRGIESLAQLNDMVDAVPFNVFTALTWLAQEEPLTEVMAILAECGGEEKRVVDTEDFSKALDHPISRQHFQVDPSEDELARMFNAPLEKWRVFLHPLQRKLVERDWSGPVRVLGGAGTGKTVVAMHRAAWLAGQLAPFSTEKVLFTTFTRNLATDIEVNLKKIVPADQMKRIEVVNLDRWVSGFLKRCGYDHHIVYDDRTAELWKTALTLKPDDPLLPDSFFHQEWEQVIQPLEITSFAQYTKAPRTGRGIPLNRRQRKQIWPVFEEYQMLMAEHNLREPADAMRDARLLMEKEGTVLAYTAIIVDEAQDMGAQAFKLLRTMVPETANDLFIVGDAHQRIYNKKVVLGQCGIKIVGRSRRLKVNYRTTEETRQWSSGLMAGVIVDDLDGGKDSLSGYVSLVHGTPPEVRHFDTMGDETTAICEHLEQIRDTDDIFRSTCMVARTHQILDDYENVLTDKGIPVYRLTGFDPEDRSQNGVRLATMHRVKGLEFDHVILCSVNKGIVPLPTPDLISGDVSVKEMAEARERSLLFVAATRTKKTLMVTSYGEKSPYI